MSWGLYRADKTEEYSSGLLESLEAASNQAVEDRSGNTVIFPVGCLLEHTIYTTNKAVQEPSLLAKISTNNNPVLLVYMRIVYGSII